MNSLAAPDVRAPSVRGRWHFQSIFKQSAPRTRSGDTSRVARARQPPGRFTPVSPSSQLVPQARLGMSGGCGYTLAIMNHAIKPGPETPLQAGLPELSVVVPTFNERDNVTVLYQRLEATLSGIAWEVVFVDDRWDQIGREIRTAQGQRREAQESCFPRGSFPTGFA